MIAENLTARLRKLTSFFFVGISSNIQTPKSISQIKRIKMKIIIEFLGNFDQISNIVPNYITVVIIIIIIINFLKHSINFSNTHNP